MFASTPNLPPIIYDQLCVVYHAESGQVLHAHRVTTFEGGHVPKEQDTRSRAIESMNQFESQVKSDQVKTLMVSPDQLKPGVSYKVDVNTVEFVATDRK